MTARRLRQALALRHSPDRPCTGLSLRDHPSGRHWGQTPSPVDPGVRTQTSRASPPVLHFGSTHIAFAPPQPPHANSPCSGRKPDHAGTLHHLTLNRLPTLPPPQSSHLLPPPPAQSGAQPHPGCTNTHLPHP